MLTKRKRYLRPLGLKTNWCFKTYRSMSKRYLRPVGLEEYAHIDGVYLVGNFKNGFVSTIEEIEKWENKIPCSNCLFNDRQSCSGPCKEYVRWFKEFSFQRITKK